MGASVFSLCLHLSLHIPVHCLSVLKQAKVYSLLFINILFEDHSDLYEATHITIDVSTSQRRKIRIANLPPKVPSDLDYF